MTRWYVASFADGDTHLGEPAPHAHLVSAHCDGRQFRPLTVLHGVPPDQAQVCPTCRSDQPAACDPGRSRGDAVAKRHPRWSEHRDTV